MGGIDIGLMAAGGLMGRVAPSIRLMRIVAGTGFQALLIVCASPQS